MTTPATGGDVPQYAAPGVLVAERYLLSRRVAGGGMGEVWRAYDRLLDQTVAVKLLRLEFLEEPAFLERFRAEARLAGVLQHEGIAAVYGHGETGGPGGAAWLVMELVEGESLASLLRRRGALPPEQALDILGQAAIALQAAHDAGVIHRDVKPGNLLIRPDGVVKITDFGIARAAGSAPLTRTGTVLGTAHYLAPEQVTGRSASTASDVYALGIVGYECLAGRRPFEGDSPVEVALAQQRDPVPPLPPQLPAPVRDLVMRSLAKNPSNRPASAGSLGRTALGIREALYTGTAPAEPAPAAAAGDDAGAVPPPPRTPRTGRTRRGGPPTARWRLPQLVLGALVLAVVIATAVHGCSSSDGSPAPTTPGASPGSAATAPSPAGISVNPQQYRGQPAATVLAALTAAGLAPRPVVVSAQGAPGTVVTIIGADGGPLPARLAKGATVLVQVLPGTAITPTTPAGGHGQGNDEGDNVKKGSD